MPFAIKPNLEDEEKNKNQNGVNISGTSGTFATGIPGQDAGGAKPQKSSGNYANIQSYLDANKDQGDQMGQNIASNVETKGQDAQSKIGGLQAKAPEVKAYDPNEAYSKLGSLDDSQKQAYRTQRATGGYSGPQSVDQVEGYADTQKAATEAASLAKNAGNEFGQQQLLKDTYKRPDYSAGQNKLDQVLLQNSAGSKKALEGISGKYSALDKMFQDTSQNVGNSVNLANQQALANKNAVLSAEEKQWQDLMNPIQARADEQNRLNPELVNRVTADAGDETLNEETLAMLGLSEGQGLYDLNLSNYINPNLTQVGLNEAATGEERSKYQALADLIQDPTRNQINDKGSAITPVSFDKEKFEKDLAGKSEEYKKAYKTEQLTGMHPYLQSKSLTPENLQELVPVLQKRMRQAVGRDDTHDFNTWKSILENAESSLNSWKQNRGLDRKVKKG